MTTRKSLKQERVALTQRASAKSLNTSLADGAKLPTTINRRRSNKDKAKAVLAQLLKTIFRVFAFLTEVRLVLKIFCVGQHVCFDVVMSCPIGADSVGVVKLFLCCASRHAYDPSSTSSISTSPHICSSVSTHLKSFHQLRTHITPVQQLRLHLSSDSQSRPHLTIDSQCR